MTDGLYKIKYKLIIMDLKNITAENMHKLTTKDSEDINNILIQIKKQAEKGKLSLYIDNHILKDTTRRELMNRGFKIETGGRYNETNTIIMW